MFQIINHIENHNASILGYLLIVSSIWGALHRTTITIPFHQVMSSLCRFLKKKVNEDSDWLGIITVNDIHCTDTEM